MRKILYVLKQGCEWRAIHGDGVSWITVYKYFRKWEKQGIIDQLFEKLEWISVNSRTLFAVDSTHVKVHRSGCNPPGGRQAQAIGVSRGGLNTKIHAIVANNGQPLTIQLTPGSSNDNPVGVEMLATLPTQENQTEEESTKNVFTADKAYDSDSMRKTLESKGLEACIPSKKNRKIQIPHDKALYERRHVIENSWEVIKRLRRVATRYDKLAAVYTAFVKLGMVVQFYRGQYDSAQFRKAI